MTEDGRGLLLDGLAYPLDRAGQLLGSPWFLEYGGNPPSGGAFRVEVLMRATAQDDREVGPEPLEFARERHARHAGHGGVGDDEVKSSRRRPKRVEGDVAVGTADCLVPQTFQLCTTELHQHGLIVDHQGAALLLEERHRCGRSWRWSPFPLGQIDREGRATATPTADCDSSAMA